MKWTREMRRNRLLEAQREKLELTPEAKLVLLKELEGVKLSKHEKVICMSIIEYTEHIMSLQG